MSVWFCPTSGSCQQLPGSQVTINSSVSASLANVSLAAGSWRIYVQTNGGPSARSAPFAMGAAPTVTWYAWTTTPMPNQPFGGTIAGSGFVADMSVWFCPSSGSCLELAASQVTVNSAAGMDVTNVSLAAGSWQIYVQTAAGPSARSTPFTVGAAPTVTGYRWTTLPMPNQPFGGTITGTGFGSPISVWFCPISGSCQQLPGSQVTINDPTSLSVTNVSLATGSWQFYVQTSGGPSGRSTSFVVGPVTPAITGYTWTTTPMPNQPFSGTITGTGFVSPITVWFCLSGGSCSQLAPSQVMVNDPTSVSVTNVSLAAGSWQIYVQTAGGPSGRSMLFMVGAVTPTITGYTWTSTPMADQAFSGTITGTGFVSPITVWFCPSGGSCTQVPVSEVVLNDPTSVSLFNVYLAAGSWQIYVQTSGGASARSTAFTVQSAAPAALLISNVAVQVSSSSMLTFSLNFSGAAGKITFGASCGGPGATELGCAWVLFEPDYGTGFRLGGSFLNKFGVASGSVSSSLSEGQATLLGPMNVKVTLIDNAGNSSNSVVVPVAHWLQW